MACVRKRLRNLEIELRAISISSISGEPPEGYCKVTNFYVDPATGKLIAEFDDIPKEEEK